MEVATYNMFFESVYVLALIEDTSVFVLALIEDTSVFMLALIEDTSHEEKPGACKLVN